MRESTEETLQIVRSILDAYTDHPTATKITVKEVPGGCYWQLKVHPDDYGKVNGRKGQHIRALTALVVQLGEAAHETYQFVLVEPDAGQRMPSRERPVATEYDPSQAVELLEWTVSAALDIDCDVESTRFLIASDRPTFTLWIKAPQPEAAILTKPDNGSTLLEAMQILWHARAQKEGVALRLELAP
ncbi:MAG: hypothetical protein WCG85_13245 [Polyangia bacterium]